MDADTIALSLLVFAAEMCVVTVGTMRIIFVARGHKFVAPVLGLFEISLWLFAAGVTMKNLDQWQCCASFALGFTLGSYLGILIEKWLALGTVIVRVITHREASELVEHLRAAHFGVTSVDGHGATGRVRIIMTIVKRKQLPEVIAIIEASQPGAFYAIDDVQSANEGIFPVTKKRPSIFPSPIARMWRLLAPPSFAAKGKTVDHEVRAAL